MQKFLSCNKFINESIKYLKEQPINPIPKLVLSHFKDYFVFLKGINQRNDLSFFFLLIKLFLSRSKFYSPKSNFENENISNDNPIMIMANEVIELFQEIINQTVNLVFAMEKHSQTNRYRFQQVNNKLNSKIKNDKPNHLKSMTKQHRIFIESLKNISL